MVPNFQVKAPQDSVWVNHSTYPLPMKTVTETHTWPKPDNQNVLTRISEKEIFSSGLLHVWMQTWGSQCL